MELTSVQISDIRTDGDTQNRCEFDRDLVSEYSRAIYDGAVFPPMLVFFDGTHYWLADGFHRHAAYLDIGQAFIDVQVKEGSLRDAQLYSFSANANHGKRRTNADKRKAVLAMLADAEWCQWASREIAKACCVSHTFVDRIRSETLSGNVARYEEPTVRKVTRNGSTYEQDTTKIGKSPQENTPSSEQPSTQIAYGDEEDCPSPEALQYTQEQADADNAKSLEEHESRMTELAYLMTEKNPLGEALREIERLSNEIVKKDDLIHFYDRRLSSVNEEINLYKRELKKYKKAFAAKDREQRKVISAARPLFR